MEEEARVIHRWDKTISMGTTYCYNSKSISTSCRYKIKLWFVKSNKNFLISFVRKKTRREQSETRFEKKFWPKKNANFSLLNLTKYEPNFYEWLFTCSTHIALSYYKGPILLAYFISYILNHQFRHFFLTEKWMVLCKVKMVVNVLIWLQGFYRINQCLHVLGRYTSQLQFIRTSISIEAGGTPLNFNFSHFW